MDPRLQIVLSAVYEGFWGLTATLVSKAQLKVKTVCEGNLSSDRVVRRMVRGRGRLGGLGRGLVDCRPVAGTWGGTLQQERLECRTILEQEESFSRLRLDVRRLTCVNLPRADSFCLTTHDLAC